MGAKSQHRPVPASGAPVWGFCSGSILASQAAPEKWSRESDDGTAAHWVGSEALDKCVKTKGAWVADCTEWLGQKAPNGVVIDEAMVEGAQVYVDDVTAIVAEYDAWDHLLVEAKVDMPQIHEHNGGTLDAGLVVGSKTTNGRDFLVFNIWDYKHGHRAVEERDRLQLIDYAAGLINKFKINGSEDQRIHFRFRIVKPFAYSKDGPVVEWSGNLADLRSEFNRLRDKAEEAYANPLMSPGKHCTDCPAVMRCDPAKRYLYALIDYANEPYVIDDMPNKALATERGILKDAQAVLKSRLSAIEDELEHRIASGAGDTGLTLQATAGNLAWKVPPEQAVVVAQQFGVDISKTGALTPTQATQRVPKEMRANFSQVLKTIAARPPGKIKLTPAEDSIAAKAFSKN